jgi:hypothetical protein
LAEACQRGDNVCRLSNAMAKVYHLCLSGRQGYVRRSVAGAGNVLLASQPFASA